MQCGSNRAQFMTNSQLVRVPVAILWLYQGLWCKIAGFAPNQAAIVRSFKFFGPTSSHYVLLGIGSIESVLAVWVLSGWQPVSAAITQIVLLVVMNGCGLLWGRNFIPDPLGMVFQNLIFVTLVVITTGEVSLGPRTN